MKIDNKILNIPALLVVICISTIVKSQSIDELVYILADQTKNAESYSESLHLQLLDNTVSFDQSIGFEVFKSNYDTVNFENETFYIVQGDLMYDTDELLDYYQTYYNDTTEYNKLVIDLLHDGKMNIMPNADKLTYAVVKSSFLNDNEYQQVVDNLRMAAKEWSDILGGKVNFRHKMKLDNKLKPSETSSKVTFVVRYLHTGSNTIASAFFPHYPKNRWKIKVAPKYYTTRADQVGIFRHEIGHILGFRHEHIRSGAPLECKRETDITFDTLTNYDSMSVMHYPCGGAGNLKLTFTERDIQGARLIYK